jgi:hypothetical protein
VTADYTDAPATDLLATTCCACGRPLLDSVSVELGMGPTCRRKAGLDGAGTGADWTRALPLLGPVAAVEGDARRTANRVVHRIAAAQHAAEVPALLCALDALGFATVAKAIREHLDVRAPRVSVLPEGAAFVVECADLSREVFDALVTALRGVPGRRYDPTRKASLVPQASKRALWCALQAALPAGTAIISARGTTVLAA